MKTRTLILVVALSVCGILGCSKDTASIRSCDRRDWPIAQAFDAEKWKADPNERIAFVTWLETNLKGLPRKDVVALLGEPERRDLADGGSEALFYSLGTGNFMSCGVQWVRELRLVIHAKTGVMIVVYEPRAS